MGRSRRLSADDCLEARFLYESGHSFKTIALAFGVAQMTATRAVALGGGAVPDSATTRALRKRLSISCGPARTVKAYVTSEGYRRVIIDDSDPMFVMGQLRGRPEHHGTRTVLEHRLVLARKLGRPLLSHETVHHKDGDRLNNHPSNLELRVGRHGRGATTSHCATCTCFQQVT